MTALLTWVLIPILRRLRAGQHILAIGPSWHMSKEGTPTMGGISFLLAVLFVSLPLCVMLFLNKDGNFARIVLILSFAFACGLIGFWDDLLKLRHEKNQGLLAWQKYFLQLLAAAVFLFFWCALRCAYLVAGNAFLTWRA
jgi:phospho-N-acetylmuramoyl-pentapeptide-transferase